MNRYELEKRLRELGIYSDFCFRKELKVIPQLLGEKEQLNCILTGVHEANRKMLVVTDRRLLIIFAGALAAKGVTVIQRGAVREYAFEKKLLFSRLSFSGGGTGSPPLRAGRKDSSILDKHLPRGYTII